MIAPGQKGLPPSLKTPSFIQTWRWLREPLPLLDECFARFGDTFTLRLGGVGNWVMVSTPADIKALFTAPADVLHAGEVNRRFFGPFAGSASSFVLDGAEHLRHRRIALPAFHSERMQAYTELVRDATEEIIGGWPRGRPFALMPHITDLILRVTVRAVFGLSPGPREQELRERLRALDELAFSSPLSVLPALARVPGPVGPAARARAEVARADRVLFEEVAARRASADVESRQDILSLLLCTRDAEGKPLSDVELRDELFSALFAGTHTTGTAMAWCFERVLSEPEARRKIEAELAAVTQGARIERSHIGQLEYLDAAIREALRARPIAPVGGQRLVKKPFAVGPYLLPPGTLVGSCAHLTFKRPDLYPEPERYRPERFLGRKADPYEWAAFGGGIRRCLGMAFALSILKTTLATVFSRPGLSIVSPHSPPSRYAFFVAPQRGLEVTYQD